jgi:hypothetical protein
VHKDGRPPRGQTKRARPPRGERALSRDLARPPPDPAAVDQMPRWQGPLPAPRRGTKIAIHPPAAGTSGAEVLPAAGRKKTPRGR